MSDLFVLNIKVQWSNRLIGCDGSDKSEKNEKEGGDDMTEYIF